MQNVAPGNYTSADVSLGTQAIRTFIEMLEVHHAHTEALRTLATTILGCRMGGAPFPNLPTDLELQLVRWASLSVEMSDEDDEEGGAGAGAGGPPAKKAKTG